MSEAITEKVKKLLRLARCKSATPAEAANALKRALEIMDKHQIDAATLDLDEETEKLVCEYIDVGWRRSLIKKLINSILRTHFKVRTCICTPRLALIGFEHDVTVAGYVFHFLVRACTNAVKEFAATEKKHRRKVTATKKQNFIHGWMYGIWTVLDARAASQPVLDDSKTSLVLAERKKRVDDHFKTIFPDTVKAQPIKDPSKNVSALMRGFAAGKATSIYQPLTGPKQTTLALL